MRWRCSGFFNWRCNTPIIRHLFCNIYFRTAEFIRQIVTWVQTTMGTSSGLYVLINIEEKTIYWRLLCLAAFVYLIGWELIDPVWDLRCELLEMMKKLRNTVVLTWRRQGLLFMISGSIAALTALLAPRWTYIEPTIAFSPMLSFLV